jgi:hypothetical protein
MKYLIASIVIQPYRAKIVNLAIIYHKTVLNV